MHEIKVPSRFRYILGALVLSVILLYGSLLGPSRRVKSNSSVHSRFHIHSNLDGNTASEIEETLISSAISSLDNLLDIRNETLGVK
jgi:hypothetical protein